MSHHRAWFFHHIFRHPYTTREKQQSLRLLFLSYENLLRLGLSVVVLMVVRMLVVFSGFMCMLMSVGICRVGMLVLMHFAIVEVLVSVGFFRMGMLMFMLYFFSIHCFTFPLF